MPFHPFARRHQVSFSADGDAVVDESFGYPLECGGNRERCLPHGRGPSCRREDDIADAEERCDLRMTQCLGEEAVLGIN